MLIKKLLVDQNMILNLMPTHQFKHLNLNTPRKNICKFNNLMIKLNKVNLHMQKKILRIL